MASISPYNTKSGKRWRVQYRDPAGKVRSKRGFTRKSDAQAWADKNATDIRAMDWLDPNAGRVTVTTLSETWKQNLSHLKPKTRHDALAMHRNHVEPEWGSRQVATIKPSEVQTWVSSFDKSASLVRQALLGFRGLNDKKCVRSACHGTAPVPL